jgi:peptidoglycan/LPS O-acetylase OafA/YrhL
MAGDRVPFSKSAASVGLDAVRGIAALAVFSDHTRHLFFAELHTLPNHQKLFLLPYIATVTGHQAVVVFFVLSGFLVGGSVIRAVQAHNWSWKRYIVHRLVRLWIVLIPALLLCWTLDGAAAACHRHWLGYSGLVYQSINGKTVDQMQTFSTFLANALFLQGISLPHAVLQHFSISGNSFPNFGTDTALWSLSFEFWYYVLFPLAVFALCKIYRPTQRLIFAIAFVLIACFVGRFVMMMFPFWLCGIALLFLPRPALSRRIRAAAALVYAPIFLGASVLDRFTPALSDSLLSLLTTVFLWVLLCGHERSSGGRVEIFSRAISRFSYTLYLVHFPLLWLIAGFFIHDVRWIPTPATLSFATFIWLFVAAYAWAVASLTEFHSEKVRNWVETHLVHVQPPL